MAGGVVRSLITRILFKSDPTGLKKVETHAGEAKRAMRAASRAAWVLKRDLRQVGTGLRNWAIGAGVAVFSVNKLIDGFAKGADENAKFARGLGISLQAYQGLTHAAQLNGVSIAELNVALPKLAQNAGNAADGSKAAADAFRRAGVQVKDSLTGKFKDPIRLMDELADSFKEGRFQGNKTQVLMNLFGRSGKKMGVLLSQGSVGIHKAMVEAKKLGIVMSASEAKIAEDYNDEMLRVKSTMAGVRNQIMVKLLPAITANMKAFIAWAKEGDNLKRMVDGLIKGFKALAIVLAVVAAAKIGGTLLTLISITKKAIFWTRLQGRATLLAYAPYIALAAAIAGVVLIIQSLVVWSQGGKSAVGNLLTHFGVADKARSIMKRLILAFKWLGRTALQIGKILVRFGAATVKVAQRIWAEFGPNIIKTGQTIKATLIALWPVIMEGAAKVGESLRGLFSALKKAWTSLKPGLIELGSALSSAFTAAKPAIVAIVKIFLTMMSIANKIAIVVIPLLGKVVAVVFKVVAWWIGQAVSAITLVVKGVTAMVNGLQTGYNFLKKIMGLQGNTELSAGLKLSVDPSAPKTGGVGKQTNNLSVGAVSVSVSGTANMTEAELTAAISKGSKQGLQLAINDTFAGMQNLVPG